VRVSLGAAMLYGALPHTGWGVKGSLGASLDAWRLDVLLLWLNAQQVWGTTPRLVGGEFGLYATGLHLGRAWHIARFLSIQPGAWALVGRLHGEAIGVVDRSTPSSDGWGAVGLEADAEVVFKRTTLMIGGGGGLPFGRPRFWLDDTYLYRTSSMAWFAHLLVGAAFP